MNTPALLIGCAGVGALALALLGLALARGAALADRRAPHPAMPAGIAHQHKLLADRWYLNGMLSLAGAARLRELMDAGADAYGYWSGGEYTGTPCVWAFRRRYALEDWNTESDTLALDTAEHGRKTGQNGGAA